MTWSGIFPSWEGLGVGKFHIVELLYPFIYHLFNRSNNLLMELSVTRHNPGILGEFTTLRKVERFATDISHNAPGLLHNHESSRMIPNPRIITFPGCQP